MQDQVVSAPITAEDAQGARIKNIIELGLGFSVMTRVFAKRSDERILKRLEEFFMGRDRALSTSACCGDRLQAAAGRADPAFDLITSQKTGCFIPCGSTSIR